MINTYDEDIGILTNNISKKLSSYLNNQLNQFNLTAEQWNVLLTLSKHENVNQKFLSKLCKKDKSTLTRILDILERKSFIKRESHNQDRRSFIVNITNEGTLLVKEVSPFLDDLFNNLLKDIPIEDLITYNKVLLTIDKNIEILQQK